MCVLLFFFQLSPWNCWRADNRHVAFNIAPSGVDGEAVDLMALRRVLSILNGSI